MLKQSSGIAPVHQSGHGGEFEHYRNTAAGVATHAIAVPAVAAFGLTAGILRERAPRPGVTGAAAEAANNSMGGESVEGRTWDELAAQMALEECSEAAVGGGTDSGSSCVANPPAPPAAAAGGAGAAVGAEPPAAAVSQLELDPSFWQQQVRGDWYCTRRASVRMGNLPSDSAHCCDSTQDHSDRGRSI